MKIRFPSPEFNDAAAAVCHGVASDEQIAALSEILVNDASARDEYILRIELHSRLASAPDLFASDMAGRFTAIEPGPQPREDSGTAPKRSATRRRAAWFLAIAASLGLLAAGAWRSRLLLPRRPPAPVISRAVAMLDQTVDARWAAPNERPSPGTPLEPGWLKLESGLAQIVFYSGARVMQHGYLVHIDGAAHNLHHDQLARTVKELNRFLSKL